MQTAVSSKISGANEARKQSRTIYWVGKTNKQTTVNELMVQMREYWKKC